MIMYGLVWNKSGKIYCYQSPQFSGLKGFGDSPGEAFVELMMKVDKEVGRRIAAHEPLPLSLQPGDKSISRKGTGHFTFPLTMELTLLLHQTMLEKNITRATLARLLALTQEEVGPEGWHLDKTLKIEPKAPPKYKKVQRLLDIKHDSSINEMSEAFRVIDCCIDARILPKDGYHKTGVGGSLSRRSSRSLRRRS